MKKSIIFTSLAAAVLSSALVSAEETSVESLASSTDATVVATEVPTIVSSETLSETTETELAATPSAVSEPSSTEAGPTASSAEGSEDSTSGSATSLSEDDSVKIDFLKKYISRGEQSPRAYDIVAVVKGGFLGDVTDLSRNEDGSYKVTLSTGQVLTVSADKIGAEVLAKLENTVSEPSSTEVETSSSAEGTEASTSGSVTPLSEDDSIKIDFLKKYISRGEQSPRAYDLVAVTRRGFLGDVTDLSRNEDGSYKVTLSTGQVLTVSADKVGAEVLAKLEKTKTEPSSTEETSSPEVSVVDVNGLMANDFSSVVGGLYKENGFKAYTLTADGTVYSPHNIIKNLRYVKTDENGVLWFTPAESYGKTTDTAFMFIPAGVKYSATDSSRHRWMISGSIFYLDIPTAHGEMSAQVSSTLAGVSGHDCLPSEVATAGHQQPSATTKADSTTSSSKATETSKVETRKENKQIMPATGDKSGLVASLVGVGLLAVAAIGRRRKTN